MRITNGLYGRVTKALRTAFVIVNIGAISALSVQSAQASSRHHHHSDRSEQVSRHHHARHESESSSVAVSHHRRHHHNVASSEDSNMRHASHHGHRGEMASSGISRHHHYRHRRDYDVAETSHRSSHYHTTHIASSSTHSDSSNGSGDDNVVDVAKRFNGTRYVFGGTSRSGFDCSGFTRYVLGASAGVSLPRTAMEQYENGRSIDRADLEPGDLVFFKNTYRHGISHVGIYIGDGHFEHAANEREGVKVDSLDEAYYSEHYAGARRVIFDREYTER